MDPVSRLEPRVEKRLAHLDALFGRAGVRYALIGATAILLQGIVLPRTTRDLDLAVSVERNLDEIRALLEAKGLRSTTTRRRFTAEDGLEIDVLPIRPGTDRVELPGGDSISRVGLDEAIAAGVRVALHDGGVYSLRPCPSSPPSSSTSQRSVRADMISATRWLCSSSTSPQPPADLTSTTSRKGISRGRRQEPGSPAGTHRAFSIVSRARKHSRQWTSFRAISA